MAKQTFTTGQVLTAAQMTSLQQTAMGGGSATAKTASYTLVAADAGTTVIMNSASATTVTVNTSLFSAGDTVFIQNIGAGISTITAGTATVNTASSLALAQYESGNLYFTAAGASIFSKADGAAAGGGKVLQVVSATSTTETNVTSTSYVDAGLSATITPTSATSKILILVAQSIFRSRGASNAGAEGRLLRGASSIFEQGGANDSELIFIGSFASVAQIMMYNNFNYLDSPATTSATTYKTQFKVLTDGSIYGQAGSAMSVMTLLEIGA